MQPINFEDAIDTLVAKDPRYPRDAYFFVREALDYTVKKLGKDKADKPAGSKERHVTGQELLDGIRQFALDQFGPMAITVLEEWGIKRCEDFGELVFNMVEPGLLGKTESDTREDFKGGYDFQDAFRKPFLPSNRSTTPSVKKPTQV